MVASSQLSVERRWKIVTFMKEFGGDAKLVAAKTPCSVKVVHRWWRRYCDTGSVDDAPRSGRPTLISRRGALHALQRLVKADSNGSADVAQQLAAAGITNKVVHKTTVIRAARQAAWKQGKNLAAKKGPPPKGLRAATKAKRIAFAQVNKKRDWRVVMFTDRKRFYLKYPGSKVKPVRWVLDGEEGEDVFQPTNPLCVNVYAGITPHGMTTMHVVAGTSKHKTEHKTKKEQIARNITKSEYKQVLWNTLLPQGTLLFKSARITRWCLQQDNDPCHGVAAQVVKDWNGRHGAKVELLSGWPPNSPDLNIIENVWAYVQQKVNMLGCKNLEEFKQAVEGTFAAVPQHVIKNLYASLDKRMKLVLKNGGDYTKY